MEDKRKRILETARKLFMAHGYKRVSMDEIARLSGCGKNTLYQFFSSKQALMFAWIDDFAKQANSMISGIIADTHTTPTEKLQSILASISTLFASLSQEGLKSIELDLPEAYERIKLNRQQIVFENIKNLISQGKQSGHYDAQIDEMIVAHIIIAALDHFTQAEVIGAFNCPPDRLFQAILNTILNGCVAGRVD